MQKQHAAVIAAMTATTSASTGAMVFRTHAHAFGLGTHAIGFTFLGLSLVAVSMAITLLVAGDK